MINIQLTPEQLAMVLRALTESAAKAFDDNDGGRWMDLTELEGSLTTQAELEEGR